MNKHTKNKTFIPKPDKLANLEGQKCSALLAFIKIFSATEGSKIREPHVSVLAALTKCFIRKTIRDRHTFCIIGKAVMTMSFICISFAACAQIPDGFKSLKDTASFIQKMTAQSKLTNTTESDFEQEKYISVMSEKIISKGHFCFKKANKLRWEYIHPFKYLIVINNGKMFIKDNGKVNKYDINSNKIFKSINEMMMSIVQGTLFNNKDYTVKYYENDKQYLMVLSPTQKGTKEFLKTINLTINKKDFEVAKVRMIEPGGDYTNLNFTDRKTNEPIADEKFVVK